jgi:hypothetical protein
MRIHKIENLRRTDKDLLTSSNYGVAFHSARAGPRASRHSETIRPGWAKNLN